MEAKSSEDLEWIDPYKGRGVRQRGVPRDADHPEGAVLPGDGERMLDQLNFERDD